MHSCLGAVLTQNETENPVQNHLKTVATSVGFWIRKKCLVWSLLLKGNAASIALLRSCIYFRAWGWWTQGVTFYTAHGAAAWGRGDTCHGVQSQSWGPSCAPSHPLVDPGSPQSSQALQLKGIQGWIFVHFVVFPTPTCPPLKPPNAKVAFFCFLNN